MSMGGERTSAAAAKKGAAEPTAHSHQGTSTRSMPHTERLSTARAGGVRPERLSEGREQRAGLRQSPSPPRHRWSWRRRIFRACTLSRERVVLRPEHTEDTKGGLSSPQIQIQIPLAAARAPDAPRADARAERAGSSAVSCDGTRAEACRWNRPACLGVRPYGPPAVLRSAAREATQHARGAGGEGRARDWIPPRRRRSTPPPPKVANSALP